MQYIFLIIVAVFSFNLFAMTFNPDLLSSSSEDFYSSTEEASSSSSSSSSEETSSSSSSSSSEVASSSSEDAPLFVLKNNNLFYIFNNRKPVRIVRLREPNLGLQPEIYDRVRNRYGKPSSNELCESDHAALLQYAISDSPDPLHNRAHYHYLRIKHGEFLENDEDGYLKQEGEYEIFVLTAVINSSSSLKTADETKEPSTRPPLSWDDNDIW